MPKPNPDRLAFGLVPPPSFIDGEDRDRRLNRLLRFIGEKAGVSIVNRSVQSYNELVGFLRSGDLDVAWLPPIPFARLEGENIVRILVAAERGGHDQFVSVLFSRADSNVKTLADVRGKRVGWVDPLSTSGYVVPRMRLAARYPNQTSVPGSLFAKESFLGSHAAVAKAVIDGTVDVGASFGGYSDDGELVRSAFHELGLESRLHVIEVFGALPPDLIAVRSSVDPDLEQKLAAAFEATSRDPTMLDAVRLTFGAMFFVRKPLVGYDLLRSEIEHGVDSGVIPAAAAFLSTKPPPPELL